MAKTAEEVFRGNPVSALHQPVPQEVVDYLKQIALQDGRKFSPTFGVLERTSTAWQLLTTSAHSALGVGSVSVNASGNLVVGFTDTDINSVVSFVAAPDATLSRYGVVTGSGVGVSTAEIYASMPLRFLLGTDGTTVSAHSFWGSKLAASLSGSTLTITHPQISQAFSNKVVAMPYNDDGSVRVKTTAGGTSTSLRVYKKLIAELTHSAGVFTSDNSEMTVESFSGGTLTLLHAYGTKRIARTQDYTTDARSHINLLTTTRAYIKFYDMAGALLTSLPDGYKFMFERDEVDGIFDGALAVTIPEIFFDYGYTALDFDDMDNTSGNVWIGGFQEVI